jgi:hypothetical protein
MGADKPLYRCFQCPALFASCRELVEHRNSHAGANEDFWRWFYRRNGEHP